MRCEEYTVEARGAAAGWHGFRADLPDEDDQPQLVFYYPLCSLREFNDYLAKPHRRD